MVLEAVDMLRQEIFFLLDTPFRQIVLFELSLHQPEYRSTLYLEALRPLLAFSTFFRGSYRQKDLFSLSIKNKSLSVLIPNSEAGHIDPLFVFNLFLAHHFSNRHETQVRIIRKSYFRVEKLKNLHNLLHDRLFEALRDHFSMWKDLLSLFLTIEEDNIAAAVGKSTDGF